MTEPPSAPPHPTAGAATWLTRQATEPGAGGKPGDGTPNPQSGNTFREDADWRRPGVGRSRPGQLPDAEVYFPPVANGLDYLLSAADHLQADEDETVGARDLKYAILHLAAGAEVLLKARLQLEHWTLVFKDPGKAKREALKNGSLTSCTPDDTVERLRSIALVPIGDKEAKALRQLAEHRNALQHYGLTGTSSTVRAVEARTAEVLDFLIRFLDDELLPALTDTERCGVAADMDELRHRLVYIQSFVKKRMQRLQVELRRVENSTVECDECWQWALVVGEGAVRCLFCSVTRTPADALLHHAVQVLGGPASNRGAVGDEPGPGELCTGCGAYTLLFNVQVAVDPSTLKGMCFTCGATVPDRAICLGCGVPLHPAQHELGCADCLHGQGEK
ncbi:hypothetical protein OG195_37745 [Streptomyces sp. NBC_01362]|uniref:hypothetical protein n=1 Tax=Streptomyces sp. NBC_01362 TaxID=2903839 RepID=UPI002E36B48A|nr:hypothetical protein [Streptomyces sp. NBC_01362]